MMALLAHNCYWEAFPRLCKELCHNWKLSSLQSLLLKKLIIFLGISFLKCWPISRCSPLFSKHSVLNHLQKSAQMQLQQPGEGRSWEGFFRPGMLRILEKSSFWYLSAAHLVTTQGPRVAEDGKDSTGFSSPNTCSKKGQARAHWSEFSAVFSECF